MADTHRIVGGSPTHPSAHGAQVPVLSSCGGLGCDFKIDTLCVNPTVASAQLLPWNTRIAQQQSVRTRAPGLHRSGHSAPRRLGTGNARRVGGGG
jgi:hypothetical protein